MSQEATAKPHSRAKKSPEKEPVKLGYGEQRSLIRTLTEFFTANAAGDVQKTRHIRHEIDTALRRATGE